MLHGQKIVFVAIVDNDNQTAKEFKSRIWHHQTLVQKFLKTENCLMGKTTYDIMQWKGPKAWVLTRDREWSRSNVGTIHDLDDLHLHTEGPIYVLGGNSVHHQLRNNMDEIHLYVMNNSRGSDPWIDMDMKDWKPIEYISKGVWSYVHLEKSLNYDPLGLNDDYLKA